VTRRAFLAMRGPGLLGVSGPAAAQSPGRVYRVARLAAAQSDPPSIEAFRRGLRELGWDVDGNLVIELRSAEGTQDRLAALAAELVTSKVDVIVAVGDWAIEAARRATTTIPIVMAVATDAVECGHVASLPRPGGNVTGLSAFLPELAGKRLEILSEVVPSARRVGVLVGRQAFHQGELTRIRAAAPTLSLEIRSVQVKAAGDFADVIRGWRGRASRRCTCCRARASRTSIGPGSPTSRCRRDSRLSARWTTTPRRDSWPRTARAGWPGTTGARTSWTAS
jgi:putative ABC transport system substrate-binding protein